MYQLLMVFIGSGLGGCCRFMLHNLTVYLNVPTWTGTMICNLLGSFIISIVAANLLRIDSHLIKYMQPFIAIGFLGGFTTFSTFSLDSIRLFQENTHLGFVYIIFTVVGSLMMCVLGFRIAG